MPFSNEARDVLTTRLTEIPRGGLVFVHKVEKIHPVGAQANVESDFKGFFLELLN